ncbi:diacylglycerol kinase catalytic region [Caldalkalibacillus thermarum TA2.A1]|uniref:Diacylglycerol kinase catalytic region n=1 Tax=Caldalkalibacillus thermarum (strain TA2.A1) TaxID=986075 RepID=F5L5P4_CALTT|nr:diacylglycerol kinase catalytic region [Caldalkalibacillus thermarum TA2.A1]
MYCFIVNRTSGHGRGGRVWKKIEAKLNEERVWCLAAGMYPNRESIFTTVKK